MPPDLQSGLVDHLSIPAYLMYVFYNSLAHDGGTACLLEQSLAAVSELGSGNLGKLLEPVAMVVKSEE